MTNPYRQLPSLDRLLDQPELAGVISQFGRISVRNAGRQLLEEARRAISAGQDPPGLPKLVHDLIQHVHARLAPSLQPLINATGVIIHTNLGRAPLSEAALAAMHAVGGGYSNLEFELEDGQRGSRYIHAEALLCEITGAEAALVVNNNAAAFTLVLRTVAADKEVIISRGELVEIGGGFRIPDILRQSGAILVEVGTTNRTTVRDYAGAIHDQTAALLKIHQSNFQQIGFTASASLTELVALKADSSQHPYVLNDLGSGTLLDTTPFGLAYEPTVQDSVGAGVDLTTFSGDKLLGGPQAGIIVGSRELVAELKRQPLTRALRVDKTTLAGLQATLLAYLRGAATEEIPVWQMISASREGLTVRAQAWAKQLQGAGMKADVRAGASTVGGGSLPGQTLPTSLLTVHVPKPDQLATRLRTSDPAVIGRIEEDVLVFDPRTVLRYQEDALINAILAAYAAGPD